MTLLYIVTQDPSQSAMFRQILPGSSVRSVLPVNGESEYSAEFMAQKLLLIESIPTSAVVHVAQPKISSEHDPGT